MRSALLVVALGLASSAAHAAPGEMQLSLEPGFAAEWGREEVRPHWIVGLDLRWGLDDFAWFVTAASIGGATEGADETPSSVLAELWVGGALALDVFRWVPHLELVAGLAGPTDRLRPTGRVGLGVDYLISEKFSLGPVVRYRPLPTGDGTGGIFSAQIRLTRRFQL